MTKLKGNWRVKTDWKHSSCFILSHIINGNSRHDPFSFVDKENCLRLMALSLSMLQNPIET